MINWDWLKLKDVGKIVTGNTPSTKDPSNYGNYLPFVKPPQLNSNYISETPQALSKKGAKKARILPPNSVMVSCIGNLGMVAVNKRKVATNQQINSIIPNKNLDSKFLFYQIQSSHFLNQLDKLSSATTVRIVNKGNFSKAKIAVPSLPIQNHIVEKIEELFSDLGNGIENLQKAKKQLKSYKQAVLKAAFEGRLTAAWREQQDDLPTPAELKQQIEEERQQYRENQLEEWRLEVKQWEEDGEPGRKPRKPRMPKELNPLTEEELQSLPKIPTRWFYHQLYYLGELGRGRSRHRPRSAEKLFKDGTYPFIQTGKVRNAGKYVTDYEKCYNEIGLEQSKLWPSETLCITIAANIAETAFLKFDACFPDSIVGFTGFDKIINPNFIFYYFHAIQQRLENYAPATAQKNINLTILENLAIPYCSPKEQNHVVEEIESRLSIINQVDKTITEELQKAEALRQSILKKAFEGRLVE